MNQETQKNDKRTKHPTVHSELEEKFKILHTVDDSGLSSNQPYQRPG